MLYHKNHENEQYRIYTYWIRILDLSEKNRCGMFSKNLWGALAFDGRSRGPF